MRKGIVVPVAIVIGMFVAATASGKITVAGHENLEGQFAFGVTGGLAEPKGPLGNEPDWSATSQGGGLDLRYGWVGTAHADFFMTSFLAAGLWYGRSAFDMRDQVVETGGGTRTLHTLLRARTSFVGAHLTGFLPTHRAWAPYAYVGVARWFRDADLSRDFRDVAPATDVFSLTDDRIGFDAGVGCEQPLTRGLGLTTSASWFYSGPYDRDIPWSGRELSVPSWQYWSVNLGLTWHMAPRPILED